ncbi:MAG: hypothetical protein EBY29_10425 [Planctomycetes bacterium]|nr:hypothetical protein [Planctomycetota bacterium]
MMAKDATSLVSEAKRLQAPAGFTHESECYLLLAIVRVTGCPKKPAHFLTCNLTTGETEIRESLAFLKAFQRVSNFSVVCLAVYFPTFLQVY